MFTKPQAKFREIMKEFDTAMLVTATQDGELRSRPMAVADVDEDGSLWFMTQEDSPKVDEIAHDSHVNVAMQSRMKYVSVSGKATPVKDSSKVDELWKESWKTWFPEGKDDPRLTLVKVKPDTGEYWDNSGANGIKYLLEAGKAYLSGTRPDVDDDVEIPAKVNL